MGRRSKEEIQQDIREPVHEIVGENRLQTYKSIAQLMIVRNDPYVQRYRQSEGTISKYARGVMETDYAVEEWVWSDINQLPIQPLTQDQKSYLTLLINKKKGMSTDELGFMVKAMEDAGYIGEDEAKDLLYNVITKDYEDVMNGFQQKFNFRPKLVAL